MYIIYIKLDFQYRVFYNRCINACEEVELIAMNRKVPYYFAILMRYQSGMYRSINDKHRSFIRLKNLKTLEQDNALMSVFI